MSLFSYFENGFQIAKTFERDIVCGDEKNFRPKQKTRKIKRNKAARRQTNGSGGESKK